jgi:type IV secretory pathway VirB9-like protein
MSPRAAVGFALALPLIGTTPHALSAQAQGTGIREVSASSRSLIPLQTRLRYTTMVVLPEGEEILDVICGDKDFWVISSTHNIAHVKPAKEGAATNLNLVTASGAVYSFLLGEKGGAGMPDLKVYVNADPSAPQGKPKYYSAAQVGELQAELTEAKAQVEVAKRQATESIAAYQQQYPSK